jgi:hypothetical protein
MNRKRHIVVLAVIALATAVSVLGQGWLESREASVQERESLFTAAQVFGLGQGQRARYCVGTLSARGPALDWTVYISNEQGTVLLQSPETHSPAGEWRCVDVPRSSISAPGEPPTGRLQVAAREIVRAPAGTQASDIVGSFELVNADGTSAGGAVAAVLYATLHNN